MLQQEHFRVIAQGLLNICFFLETDFVLIVSLGIRHGSPICFKPCPAQLLDVLSGILE